MLHKVEISVEWMTGTNNLITYFTVTVVATCNTSQCTLLCNS